MPFEAETGIPRGAARAIFEITEFASSCQIKELVDLDGLKVLFTLLDLADPVTFKYSLTAIERILKVGDKDVLKARLGKGNGVAVDEDVLRARPGEGEGEAGDVVLGKDGAGEGKGEAGDKDVLGDGEAGDEDVLGEDCEDKGKSDNESEEGESESSDDESEEGVGERESERESSDDESESERESSDDESKSKLDGESDGDGKSDTEGDIEGVAEENEYAKLIDGYCPGWRMLAEGYGTNFVHHSIECKARRVLKKYRPAVYATTC